MTREEIERILANEVVDTAEAVAITGFTRQYFAKLVKTGKLKPLKQMEKGTLFYRPDIEALKQS